MAIMERDRSSFEEEVDKASRKSSVRVVGWSSTTLPMTSRVATENRFWTIATHLENLAWTADFDERDMWSTGGGSSGSSGLTRVGATEAVVTGGHR